MSRKPGPQGHDPHSPLLPARTPGPLGVRDAAEPYAPAELGDTPGPLGVNDAAERHASGGWPVAKSQVILIAEVVLTAD
jgi:hypothetical protein